MKKSVLSILLFALVLGFAGFVQAGVVFLANDKASIGSRPVGSGDNENTCSSEGYAYTSQNCAGELLEACSSNSAYFKFCCPSGYRHTKAECVGNVSADNCHGYYKCEVNL